MKYIILCFSLFVLPLSTIAQESRTPYWVVGSFNSMRSASEEHRRLEDKTGLPIQIATFNKDTTSIYRLVVANSQVSESQLEIEGIEPWTLSFAEKLLEHDLETLAMDYYLVLSSFKHVDRAQLFADQVNLKEVQPVEVSVTEVNNETRYRVVSGPFDQRFSSVRDSYNEIVGHDTWWLLTARSEPAQINTEPVIQATAISPETPIQESELRGPEIGDSYVKYCGTKANGAEREAFCSDSQVEREISKTVEILGLNDRTYVAFCTKASGDDRMKYCTNEFLDRRTARKNK